MLAQALSQRQDIKLVDQPPYFRRIKDFSFFARNTLALLPTLLGLYSSRKEGWLTLEDIVWMVILKGWHRVLKRLASDDKILILDEGPLFYMAFLRVYGQDIIRSESANQWWSEMYRQWADTLDMVILLDTRDPILIQRIRSRDKWHGVKIKSDTEAYQYLADLRNAYEQILTGLKAHALDLNVLRFDTEQISVKQICNEIINAFCLPQISQSDLSPAHNII
jgi:hypothetical protein